jgi:CBS domain-containing protein
MRQTVRMKPLDALARSHERVAARKRAATWFEDHDSEDEITTKLVLVAALARTPIVASPHTTFDELRELLRESSSVVVMDGDRFVGVATAGTVLAERDPLMVTRIPATTTLTRAAACFPDHPVAVVVGTDGAIVGVVTAHDVLRALASV